MAVHLLGADLDFQVMAFRTNHRSMQRAVEVFLGIGDVVVKLARYVVPEAVDMTEG